MIVPIGIWEQSSYYVTVSQASDTWDADNQAFVYLSKDLIDSHFGGDREKAAEVLRAEARQYGQYLTNDTWGFQTVEEDGSAVDSCWGFYGDTLEETGILKHLEDGLETYAAEAWDNRFDPNWEPEWPEVEGEDEENVELALAA